MLPEEQWHIVQWREGTKGTMQSRFARLRVRAAHRDYGRANPRAPEWLLMEWPAGEKGAHEVLAVHRPGSHHHWRSSSTW